MENLKSFLSNVPVFVDIPPASQIDCFSYFLTEVEEMEGISPKDVAICFEKLKIQPYSNIPSYFRNHSNRSKKSKQKFFLKNNKYFLTQSLKDEIKERYLGKPKTMVPTNKLFPIELFDSTREYVLKIAKQASLCFDYQLFDACAVMLRRLLETLIIESFERNGLDSKIKNGEGNFLYLDDLIDAYSVETAFNISRNSKTSLKKLKGIGDMSAHNRRYLAKESDIISKREELRIVLEEMLHIIDYPTWKK